MARGSVLAQDDLCATAAAQLRGDGRRCVLIEGPTASGKTVLAGRIVERLRAGFSPTWTRGDRLDRQVDEHALQHASLRPTRREVAEVVSDAAEDLGDLLADDGVPFGKIAHRALTHVLAGGRHRQLSEGQQRFLARLLTVALGRRPLLVADDLHYWDPVSLRFLRDLLRGRLDEHYGRLRRLAVVLIVDRTRAESSLLPLLDAVLDAAHPMSFEQQYAPLAEYALVLRLLGLKPELPEADIATLHLLTGGNLALSRLVVEELQGGPADIAQASAATFQQLLGRRLAAASAGGELSALMGLLAASGDALGLDELACALRCPIDAARAQAEAAAEALTFISLSDDRLRLAHETLQPIVSAALGADGRAAHGVLAACLARLRPGDYGRRAAHLAAAGDMAAARQLEIIERLCGVRQGRYAWSPPAVAAAAVDDPVAAAARAIDAALQADQRGGRLAAIKILEQAAPAAPVPLRWELTLLRAHWLGEMNEDAAVEQALGLLEDLDEAREAEPELWGRSRELQIVMLSNLRRPAEGRRIERMLREVHGPRAAFDPSAALALNRIRRSAEAIHSPQIAHDRLQLALRFFTPDAPHAPPAYPAEYLATLNNLCANEMLLGRFASARAHARRIARVDGALIEVVLPRPQLVWSNVLLCELLNGGPAAPIADAFLSLVRVGDLRSVDEMLLEINLSAAQALAGRAGAARERLEAAYDAFRRRGASQPYVGCFTAANLAVLAWLGGHDDAVAGHLAAAGVALQAMETAEYSPPFLAARMHRLDPILRSRPRTRRLETLETALAGPPQVGESWAFFARPLLATDIQFWSDL